MSDVELEELVDEREVAKPAPVMAGLDATRPTFIAIFGHKGSGKSVMAARYWQTWPRDRLVIDPLGDAFVGIDDDMEHIVEERGGELPPFWIRDDDKRNSLHYVPDVGAPDFKDNLDRALGLVWTHPTEEHVFTWIDEIGEVSSASKTLPMMRRILQQGRHHRISAVMAGPRPIDIDPLILSQADHVYIFKMPHPRDIERVASTLAIGADELTQQIAALKKYEYLRFDVEDRLLTSFPALPEDLVRSLSRSKEKAK